MRSRTIVVFLFFVSFLLVARSSFGQGTDLGTVRGTVTDPSGAVVAGAKVTVIDALTNTSRVISTNSEGSYQVFGLKPGTYEITIEAPGMSKSEIHGVVLNGSDVVTTDVVLKVSSAASSSVVVTMEAPTINTEDQTISQTLTNDAVIELPRDSRNVYTFLYLNPNITQGSADGEFKFLGAQSYGGSFSLDGQRSNGGIFGEPTASQPSLEAVGEINVLTTDFSAEYAGVANIRVSTKRGGSQYHGSIFYNNSNSALAAWTLDDKNAKADFAPSTFQSKYPNPYFNLNDLGASLGGPVPKLGKTWFMLAYERNYNIAPVKVSSATIMHPSLYTGDFSGLNDSAKPVVPASVTLTPQEIADNTIQFTDDDGDTTTRFVTIPSRLLNPTVQAMINTYFPKIGLSAPINPSNGRIPGGFQTILSGRSVQDLGTMRIDHDFSERDHIYGVYNVSAQVSANANVVNPYTGLGLTQNDRKNHTVSLSYTHAWQSRFVNELRGGFNRQALLRHSNTTLEGFLSSIGFDQSDIAAYGDVVGPFALSTFGHPAVSFGSFYAAFSNGGRNTFRPLDQNLITMGDTFTWIIGKHDLRMGGDLVRNQAVDGFALNRGNPRGLITYTGSGTNPFTGFLLGSPPNSVTFVLQPRPAMDVHNWEHGYFFQDTWKVTSKLTVNLGLRYELITPFVDKNDLIANFDPDYVNPTTGQLGRFIIPSEKTLKYLDTRIINFGYALVNDSGQHMGRGLVRTDITDFAPRVGVAYRLGSKSVIRGGYGIYYPTSAAQGIRDPIATNPFNQGIRKNPFDADGNPFPIDGWPSDGNHGISPITGGIIASGTGGTPAVNVVPFDLKQPRIHQYNATFEREIATGTSVRLSYLGSTMHGLIAGKDLNEIVPSDTPFGTSTGDGVTACDPIDAADCEFSDADLARYRFPELGDFIISFGNYGHARSNAFQAQVERRYTHGLMFQATYTYLDQKSTALDTGNSSLGGLTYNQFQPESDYGIDGYISRHRFVAYGIYDLPLGRGRRFGTNMSRAADLVLGGWQTTFNMFAKSGTGFTPFWTCDDCTNSDAPVMPGNIGVTSIDAVGDFNGPNFRPMVVGDFNQKSGDRIWNPDAFAPPTVGADLFSNPQVAKRNLLWGPGTWGVNLGLHKDFHVTDRVGIQFGADVDNIFNHPLLSPNSDAGGGGGEFAWLGSFTVRIDPATRKVLPIAAEDIVRNDNFGRLISSFTQEGINNRRTIRLRLRLTF